MRLAPCEPMYRRSLLTTMTLSLLFGAHILAKTTNLQTDDLPQTCTVQIPDTENKTSLGTSSGILVNDNWVLTVNHSSLYARKLLGENLSARVTCGDDMIYNATWHSHPSTDLALIQLNDDTNSIDNVNLMSPTFSHPNLLSPLDCKVGILNADDSVDWIDFRKEQLTFYFSSDVAKELLAGFNPIKLPYVKTFNQIAVTPRIPGHEHGHSGSGLFCRNQNHHWTLLGLLYARDLGGHDKNSEVLLRAMHSPASWFFLLGNSQPWITETIDQQ